MADTIIQGGTVVTAEGVLTADVAITGEVISAIGDGLTGSHIIPAEGKLVCPGGVDPHCHVEQMSGMGLMNADTWETATRSAALGGTTTLISHMPQLPGQRLRDAMADYFARAERGAAIDHAFHMIVADPEAEALHDDLAALISDGHRTLKLFTTYNIGLSDRAILEAMATARKAGALVCVHAENDGMIGFMKAALTDAGLTRPKHHALSHPRLAEIEAIERMCRFAEFLDQPLMIFHVSTAEGVEAVRTAKSRGVPVVAETCTHYLFQTAEVLDQPGMEGAKWMCSPPQRTPADQEALWAGLADGTLSLVSSDHAPFRFDETGKLANGAEPPFTAIANGQPGLGLRNTLMFDAMVSKGRMGVAKFVDLTATTPAKLHGLDRKGRIAPGMDADITIWDPAKTYTYQADDLHDAVGYNPAEGTTVTGWPERVILRGHTIVENGTFTLIKGRWQKRDRVGLSPTGRQAPELESMRTA
ncbi:MAG: dihydropyrimidinase [Pseudomonadota bacterium]